MATLTKTVKASGGDYTTIAAALAFFDNYDFVGDATYDTFEVVIYPEGGGTNGEWVTTAALTVASDSAAKTSATRYLTIKGSAGLSFSDTDELKYDNSKGTSISHTPSFSSAFDDLPNYTRLVDLQIEATQSTSAGLLLDNSGAAYNDNVRFNRVIIRSGSTCVNYNQSGKKCIFINCLFGTDAQVAINHPYSTTDDFIACTFRANSASDAVLTPSGGTTANDVISTLCFNVGAGAAFMSSATYSGSSRNCGSDDTTGPSTGKVSNLTIGDVFEGTTWGSEDFRVKSTASTVTTGGYAATSYTGDVDIRGTARGASPTIGCWEYPSSGVATDAGGMLLSSRRNRLTIP